jgi:hypothetical protein
MQKRGMAPFAGPADPAVGEGKANDADGERLDAMALPEDSVRELEASGSALAGVYRDLMERRRTWQARIATYATELQATEEKTQALAERLERAERSRKGYQAKGEGEGGGEGGEEEDLTRLQARELALRVEVDALKTSKVSVGHEELNHGAIQACGD